MYKRKSDVDFTVTSTKTKLNSACGAKRARFTERGDSQEYAIAVDNEPIEEPVEESIKKPINKCRNQRHQIATNNTSMKYQLLRKYTGGALQTRMAPYGKQEFLNHSLQQMKGIILEIKKLDVLSKDMRSCLQVIIEDTDANQKRILRLCSNLEDSIDAFTLLGATDNRTA